MRTATALLCAAALALTLSACATDTGDEEFLGSAWEKSKDATDEVAREGTDAMEPTNEKAQGFFEHLWH
jgi:hypothetical protein